MYKCVVNLCGLNSCIFLWFILIVVVLIFLWRNVFERGGSVLFIISLCFVVLVVYYSLEFRGSSCMSRRKNLIVIIKVYMIFRWILGSDVIWKLIVVWYFNFFVDYIFGDDFFIFLGFFFILMIVWFFIVLFVLNFKKWRLKLE